MPVNRWAPVVGVLALCLGLILIVGVAPARPATVPEPTVAVSTATPTPTVTATVSPTATPTLAIPAGYRIRVPRLAIDLPIAEGDVERDTVRQETPENFAFHLPGTALPAEGGNSYIYAHARTGMFLALWNAREGDVVLLVTPDGRELHYVVSEVHPRVAPTDVSWAAASTSDRLTLQTSTGPNPGDPRFVVIAVPT
jgi:LPXTG-site transpeptidase (sortase) family protein